MINNLPILPVLIPLLFAVIAFFVREKRAWAHRLSFIGATAMLCVGAGLLQHVDQHGIIALQLGGWRAPFGISFVADTLSALLVATSALVGFACIVYAKHDLDESHVQRGAYSLIFILLAGVNGAFLTGDIFNLYVWFEVMLISSFCLLIIGRTKEQTKAALHYVTLNLIKTALLLLAIGLLYGLTGTLNMADLHLTVPSIMQAGHSGTLTVIGAMLLLAFGIKAAMFPLHAWLPASYHAPSSTIGALMAGLLTKVGVYAMLRVFVVVLPLDALGLQSLLLILAILTMLIGMAGAVSAQNITRILSYNLVGHIGSMLAGLAIFTSLALKGLVFYMVHHILLMAGLFLAAGIMKRITGGSTLSTCSGLYQTAPLLAALFLCFSLSLAGMPPFSGFWGKLLLVSGSLNAAHYITAYALLATGILTLYSMMRIWMKCYLSTLPSPSGGGAGGEGSKYSTDAEIALTPTPLPWGEGLSSLLPICMLCAIAIAIGLMPDALLELAERAAIELTHPAAYIEAVLGGAS